MSNERRGALLAASAYVLWGLFPLYWPLFEPAGAEEILAHRIIWSFVATSILLLVLGRGRRLVEIITTPRLRWLMLSAGALIGGNWFMYIWGVNNGYVVETSLGYYINPLVTVLLGVLVLSERLRRIQWGALGVGLLAVVVLSIELGHPPYIALFLALSFGSYGLVKKRAGVGPVEGITFEAAMLAPIAAGYLAFATAEGTAESWSQGPWHIALLTTMGIVTALPLLLFSGAANRVSLTTMGMLQYVTPTIQFIIGVAVFHEPMPLGRWAGFALVWVALAVLAIESLVVVRRRRLAPPSYAEVCVEPGGVAA